MSDFPLHIFKFKIEEDHEQQNYVIDDLKLELVY